MEYSVTITLCLESCHPFILLLDCNMEPPYQHDGSRGLGNCNIYLRPVVASVADSTNMSSFARTLMSEHDAPKKLVWDIENLRLATHLHEYMLASPIFTTATGERLQLHMYPRGACSQPDNKCNKDNCSSMGASGPCMSVFLCNVGLDSIFVRFVLTVELVDDKKGDVQVLGNRTYVAEHIDPGTNWGFFNLVPDDRVLALPETCHVRVTATVWLWESVHADHKNADPGVLVAERHATALFQRHMSELFAHVAYGETFDDLGTEGSTQKVIKESAALRGDFTIVIGRGGSGDKILDTFVVHKSILAARSPVFRLMLSNGMAESRMGVATLDDIDRDVFLRVLQYLYMGMCTFDCPRGFKHTAPNRFVKALDSDDDIDSRTKSKDAADEPAVKKRRLNEGASAGSASDLTGRNGKEAKSEARRVDFDQAMEDHDIRFVCHLLLAANRFDLSALADLCTEHLIQLLTADNVIHVLVFADRQQHAALKQRCINFIMSVTSETIRKPEFAQLDKSLVCELLGAVVDHSVLTSCKRKTTAAVSSNVIAAGGAVPPAVVGGASAPASQPTTGVVTRASGTRQSKKKVDR
jgi:hypothetical protein